MTYSESMETDSTITLSLLILELAKHGFMEAEDIRECKLHSTVTGGFSTKLVLEWLGY